MTDSRGSSYLSSTALTGGSGQLNSNNKGGNDPSKYGPREGAGDEVMTSS